MRIGVVFDKFPDVAETFIVNHINGLMDRGHMVTIFAGRRGSRESLHEDCIK